MKRLKRELAMLGVGILLWLRNPDGRFGRCRKVMADDECVAGAYDRYYWIAFFISVLVVIIYRYLQNPSDD